MADNVVDLTKQTKLPSLIAAALAAQSVPDNPNIAQASSPDYAVPDTLAKAINSTPNLSPDKQPEVPSADQASAPDTPVPAPIKAAIKTPDLVSPPNVPPPAPILDALSSSKTADDTGSIAAAPPKVDVHQSLGQKIISHIPQVLMAAGVLGGGMEAAGSPGHEAPNAARFQQSMEAEANRTLTSKKLDIEKQQADTNEAYRTEAAKQFGLQPIQVPDPNDPTKTITAYVQQKDLGGVVKQGVANKGKTDTAAINKRFASVPGVGLFDTQTRQVIPGTSQGITITPEIASDYKLPPDFIGKSMKLSDLTARDVAAARNMATVQGAKGPALVNKITKEATDLGLGNPGGAARQSGVTDVMGDDGNPTPMTDAQRLAAGKAKVGSTLAVGKEENKIYEPAVEADTRLKQMYQQATDKTGASDQALLFNHIAMTGGQVKGLRMGEYLTEEHRQARGISDQLGVMWNHLVAGESLSPSQRVNFVRLAEQVRQSKWDQANRQAALSGVGEAPAPDADLPAVKSVASPNSVPIVNRTPKNSNNTPTDVLPPAAAAQLQEGHNTTFGNGQVWTKTNGKNVRVK